MIYRLTRVYTEWLESNDALYVFASFAGLVLIFLLWLHTL